MLGFSLTAFLSLMLHWYSAITPVHPAKALLQQHGVLCSPSSCPLDLLQHGVIRYRLRKGEGEKKNCLSTKLSQLAGVGSAIKDSDFQCDSYCT